MAWASIGTAIAGSVAGSVVNNVLGGGGGGASGQAMAQADPFAQYRAQFAPQVVNQTGVQGTATNAAGTLQAQNATTQQGLAQTYASQMAGIPAQSQGVANQIVRDYYDREHHKYRDLEQTRTQGTELY